MNLAISGSPTPEETAAVTAVLAALAAAAASARQAPAPPPQPSAWLNRERLLRPPVHPAPGAWRASGLPS